MQRHRYCLVVLLLYWTAHSRHQSFTGPEEIRVIAGMAETVRVIQPMDGLIEPCIKTSPSIPER